MPRYEWWGTPARLTGRSLPLVVAQHRVRCVKLLQEGDLLL
jgi:hypothetical protein